MPLNAFQFPRLLEEQAPVGIPTGVDIAGSRQDLRLCPVSDTPTDAGRSRLGPRRFAPFWSTPRLSRAPARPPTARRGTALPRRGPRPPPGAGGDPANGLPPAAVPPRTRGRPR